VEISNKDLRFNIDHESSSSCDLVGK